MRNKLLGYNLIIVIIFFFLFDRDVTISNCSYTFLRSALLQPKKVTPSAWKTYRLKLSGVHKGIKTLDENIVKSPRI